jgi:hypothetical protein
MAISKIRIDGTDHALRDASALHGDNIVQHAG